MIVLWIRNVILEMKEFRLYVYTITPKSKTLKVNRSKYTRELKIKKYHRVMFGPS